MKRFGLWLCGSLLLFAFVFSTGISEVQAADDCECPGTVIIGAERNQLVAELLKNDDFKAIKKELEAKNYQWNGAGAIEVRDLDELIPGVIGYKVVFADESGFEVGAAIFNVKGTIAFAGVSPIDEH
ncbi:hypothetical protein [Bacillus sp. B15-48]|uniref:hypothetical protein n=1 Tax=Bacillus sp. B15-48 TaxID=1548601 RepID=UPI00193FF618|nr:hypothetical protein [Bacillus sp. B15-48]MBM4760927.1 hypothetical protein [Bacillus sp. B15-48]